jgi:hypothetical protein
LGTLGRKVKSGIFTRLLQKSAPPKYERKLGNISNKTKNSRTRFEENKQQKKQKQTKKKQWVLYSKSF